MVPSATSGACSVSYQAGASTVPSGAIVPRTTIESSSPAAAAPRTTGSCSWVSWNRVIRVDQVLAATHGFCCVNASMKSTPSCCVPPATQ